jgi:hypothetical protein
MSTPKVPVDRIARIAALVLLGGTVVAMATTVFIGFVPVIKAKAGWSEPARQAYAIGQTIDLPSSVYSSNKQTLVVFASGTCGACLRSSQALSGLVSDFSDSSTRVLLVTPATMKADQQAFERGIGIPISQHLSMDTSKLRLTMVPTIALVDATGKIVYAREGLLDEEGRQAIRHAAGLSS